MELLNKVGTSPSHFIGLSTESKPTNVDYGSTFYEEDTGTAYVYGSSGWVVDTRRSSGGSSADVGTAIHAATSQNPPVDADEFGFWGSVATALRKSTWAQIKAALKTYFDTLYQTPLSAGTDYLVPITTAPGEHTASGLVISMTAGTALARGQVCYIGADGKLELCDAEAAATMPAFCMVTDATIAENAVGNVLVYGVYQDASWSWATVGALLYPGATPGTIVDVVPAGVGDQVQPIGWVVAATKIFLLPYPLLVEVGTGVATVAEGGTGLSTIAANSYIKGNDASNVVPRTYAEVKTDLSLNNVDNTSNATERAATATLTNKRITKRTSTLPSNDETLTSGNAEYDVDIADIFLIADLQQITDFGVPGGTPTNGQSLQIRMFSTTGYALTWNAIFREIGVTKPAAIAAGKWVYVGLAYNTTGPYWDMVAVATQA